MNDGMNLWTWQVRLHTWVIKAGWEGYKSVLVGDLIGFILQDLLIVLCLLFCLFN